MSDENFTKNENTSENEGSVPENNPEPAIELPDALSVDNAAETDASDDTPKQSTSPESATPNTASSYVPPCPPPHNSHASAINMHIKKRKTPAWAIVLISLAVIFYLIVVASFCLGVVSFFTHSTVTFNRDNGRIQITDNDGKEHEKPVPQKKDEEYLHITETPEQKDSSAAEEGLSVKEISKKVRTSVVGVICQSSTSFSGSSVGSGIIMTADGYIITNNHVIEGMTTIRVVLDDGKSYDAHLIGSDSRTDLAVVKIKAENLPVAEFGDSDKLEQGDRAIAIGNPAGMQLQNSVTAGIISAINRDIVIEDRTMTLIQTDASINPGNSGGPLVNAFGQVIGINTVKVGISYYEGLGFAIPINTAKPIIDELISRGYVKGRPTIGINGTTLSARDAEFYGLPEGLYVEYVHPKSDAYAKGLRRGDVITKMNGTALSSTAEIKKIRDEFVAGDTVTLTIYRYSEEHELKVILMDEAELSAVQNQEQ